MKNEIEQTEVKEAYQKPEIEVIEMETEGSILAGSDLGNGGGYDGW